MNHPFLVCLVPVRNGMDYLGGYLASVSRVADCVVALDDGSTDETGDALRAHALVAQVLTNPARTDHRSWDDGENRNRLLSAAADMSPRWILSLDVDERLDPDDAAALRRFIEEEDGEGYGYLLPIYNMLGDESHHCREPIWAGRLFRHRRGQRFPSTRLHAPPLPTDIPRRRWIRTTFRIKHLGGMTAQRRAARYSKYLEADPGRRFQRTYEHLLHEQGNATFWRPRPPELPPVFNGPFLSALRTDCRPLLSVVMIARNDAARIVPVCDAFASQIVPGGFEIIAVCSGSDETAEVIRARLPEAHVVELGTPVLPGAARNAGLRLAGGRYVQFAGSHVELERGALAATVEAHELGFAMVMGTMHNGVPTPAGWASYVLDNPTALPKRRSGPLRRAPVRCSYLKAPLIAVGGFPEHLRAGEDTVVNTKLFDLGYGAYRQASMALTHRSPCVTPSRLLSHHVSRGRSMGRILAAALRDGAPGARKQVALHALGSVPRRMASSALAAVLWGGPQRSRLLAALPLATTAAIASWSASIAELARILLPSRRDLICRALGAQRSGSSQARRVALTFDDGPSDVTAGVLDVLASHGVLATFFLLGEHIPGREHLVRRIIEEGHEAASHGMWHRDMSQSAVAAWRELRFANRLLRTAGVTCPTSFRPPFGERSGRLVLAARALQLRTVLWNVDPQDWKAADSTSIIEAVAQGVKPGSIILLHERSVRADVSDDRTLAALPAIIETLTQRGYSPVTCSTLLGLRSSR